MRDLIPCIKQLCSNVYSNGLEWHLNDVKDLLYVFLMFSQKEYVPNDVVFEMSCLMSLLSIFDIDDIEVNKVLLDSKLLLAKYYIDGLNERDDNELDWKIIYNKNMRSLI